MVETVALFFFTLFAFAGSLRGLERSITENVTMLSLSTGLSRRAVRVGRGYKIAAWGILSLLLFATFIDLFVTVLRQY